MVPKENNFAYIDGANLHKGTQELGWRLDYKRFRIFLREKYAVSKAYIFLGFTSTNTNLYRDLQNWGYTVIFKPTIPDRVVAQNEKAPLRDGTRMGAFSW